MESQNLCAMVSSVSTIHIRHLSSMSLINLLLQELIIVALCQMEQMYSPSLHLQVLSQMFLHLSLRLGVRMPCHLVIKFFGAY